jgi:mono/diheme cytochrome c family protein
MKKLGSIAAVMVVTLFIAAPVSAQDATGRFASRTSFGEKTGEQMYNAVCAGCHMQDAKGAKGAGTYPALASNANLEASGYPLLVLMQGLRGMPPLAPFMTDQQVADVINYVRTHFGNQYKDALTAADVKAMR